MLLQENRTHKAIQTNGFIKIYLKGLDKNAVCPKGKKLYTNNDFKDFPHWFKDELIDTIPITQKDNLFNYFETFNETNRILLVEANNNGLHKN